MKITLLATTRGRPQMLADMISSAFSMAEYPNKFNVGLYVDDDDVETIQKVSELQFKYDIATLVGPRIALSEATNRLYKEVQCNEIIFFVADDLKFECQNWDTKLINAFKRYPDMMVMVYFDDGWVKHNFATHPAISRESIEVMGRVLPDYLQGEFQDTWLNDIFDSIGRKERLDGIVRHIHFSPGLRDFDQIDADKYTRQRDFGCENTYNSEKGVRDILAGKLLEYIRNYNASSSITTEN